MKLFNYGWGFHILSSGPGSSASFVSPVRSVKDRNSLVTFAGLRLLHSPWLFDLMIAWQGYEGKRLTERADHLMSRRMTRRGRSEAGGETWHAVVFPDLTQSLPAFMWSSQPLRLPWLALGLHEARQPRLVFWPEAKYVAQVWWVGGFSRLLSHFDGSKMPSRAGMWEVFACICLLFEDLAFVLLRSLSVRVAAFGPVSFPQYPRCYRFRNRFCVWCWAGLFVVVNLLSSTGKSKDTSFKSWQSSYLQYKTKQSSPCLTSGMLFELLLSMSDVDSSTSPTTTLSSLDFQIDPCLRRRGPSEREAKHAWQAEHPTDCGSALWASITKCSISIVVVMLVAPSVSRTKKN